MCGRQGSPFMWAHGSWLSWCPTTSHVPVKLEVSTGNGDRLPEVDWKSFSNLKWPEHTASQNQTAFRTIMTIWTNERAYRINQLLLLLVWVSPTSTQPKHVLKADGEPEGSNRQPWSIVQLQTSALRSRSTLPGVPSLDQPDGYSTNASICVWMELDRIADWWSLGAALPPSLP